MTNEDIIQALVRMSERIEEEGATCDDASFINELHAYVRGLKKGRQQGAAVAFGLMGMAEAIRFRTIERDRERHCRFDTA
jgi:hypothetical protein